ncbi:hypothetical protein SODALDRAFT_379290 [Sodiomyces alkalinus F11]|uniref:Uncharacterized protein n=1 Tax=Sodiomyces alkalinus (strain CBS 110278 / VKM F-3762 / F11) TaxID=1314773 RepID=A0A3N2PU88_SODAK|nr:hypothetical protein SODALDRAFT_379290 [Sodiomyces alkalinus F11]ROT38065.1 hypothetical protein SODALDRAFT_379290 [Sodiomyces alkalinus F11]
MCPRVSRPEGLLPPRSYNFIQQETVTYSHGRQRKDTIQTPLGHPVQSTASPYGTFNSASPTLLIPMRPKQEEHNQPNPKRPNSTPNPQRPLSLPPHPLNTILRLDIQAMLIRLLRRKIGHGPVPKTERDVGVAQHHHHRPVVVLLAVISLHRRRRGLVVAAVLFHVCVFLHQTTERRVEKGGTGLFVLGGGGTGDGFDFLLGERSCGFVGVIMVLEESGG